MSDDDNTNDAAYARSGAQDSGGQQEMAADLDQDLSLGEPSTITGRGY